MTPAFFIKTALEPALSLLPVWMDTPAARAMVIAVCLQESRLTYRRQTDGPARGYAQFEQSGGVIGVLTHPASRNPVRAVLAALDYDPGSGSKACWCALEHNDILTASFARLLLWTEPKPLPAQGDIEGSWQYYVDLWRPGKPQRLSWEAFFLLAWEKVGVTT